MISLPLAAPRALIFVIGHPVAIIILILVTCIPNDGKVGERNCRQPGQAKEQENYSNAHDDDTDDGHYHGKIRVMLTVTVRMRARDD